MQQPTSQMISIDDFHVVEDVEAQQAEEVPAQPPMHAETHTRLATHDLHGWKKYLKAYARSTLRNQVMHLCFVAAVAMTVLGAFSLSAGMAILGIFCFACAAAIFWVTLIMNHLRVRTRMRSCETVDAPLHRMCDEFPIIEKVKSGSTTDMAETSSDDMCCICLGPKEAGERLRQLPICLHDFHSDCFDSWCSSQVAKSSGLRCPLCRQAHPVRFPAGHRSQWIEFV
jgi:hypothetical protein